LHQEIEWYHTLFLFQRYLQTLIQEVNLPKDVCRRMLFTYMFEFVSTFQLENEVHTVSIQRIEYDSVQKNQISSKMKLPKDTPVSIKISCQVNTVSSRNKKHPSKFEWSVRDEDGVLVFLWNFDMNKLLNFRF
jgi:hypothetical protein